MTPEPITDYLAGLSPGSQRAQRSALRAWAIILGHRTPYAVPWAAVGAVEVRQARVRLRSLYAGATVNRMLAALRGVLGRAHPGGVPPELAAELEHNEAPTGGVAGRVLGPGELRKLLAAARPTAQGVRDAAMVALMAGSGLRRDSIVKLDVGDWDRAAGSLLARKAKGGRTYGAALQSGLRPWLEQWLELRTEDPGPLFPRIRGGRVTQERLGVDAVSDAVEALRLRADVPPFTPHDLRRTFGTALLDGGVDLSAVAKLMGHADAKTTQIYDRRAPERLAALAEQADLLGPSDE